MSIPTPGTLVSAFITTHEEDESGTARTIVDNLAAFGSTRPANVNQYHAAYEAVLEAAISEQVSIAVASVFTFGAILDLTSSTNTPASINDPTYYATGGTGEFDISLVNNFPEIASNKNIGTYYKLSIPGGVAGAKYRVKLDSNDTSGGLVIENGDAVIVYQPSTFKTLDKIDNVQTSVLGVSGTVDVTPNNNSSSYTVDLSQTVKDTLALVDTTESAADIRDSVNTALTSIMQRLQTVTNFMSFIESTGNFIDANGNPIAFTNLMNTTVTPVTSGNLLLTNNVVQYPQAITYNPVALSASSYAVGATISVEINSIVVLIETIDEVSVSVDGGLTYIEMVDAGATGAYSAVVSVPQTTATTGNKVFIKITTDVNSSGYIIRDYGTYDTTV